MKPLIVIPARGGSKGIPHKNIKPLDGKPLIYYSIDVARHIIADEDICISTDDPAIIRCVEDYGLNVPFVRPDVLATDKAGTRGVLLHALDFYREKGRMYDTVILLQTTSPFRTVDDVRAAISLYDFSLDAVVSVKEMSPNPYYNGYEESDEGYLHHCLGDGHIDRRQDAPVVYAFNGAVYVFNVDSLRRGWFSDYARIRKYLMDEIRSVDLDTPIDWCFAEMLIKEGFVKL